MTERRHLTSRSSGRTRASRRVRAHASRQLIPQLIVCVRADNN
jgi:hypothetical protein